MTTQAIDRTSWGDVTSAFTEFFSGLGEVSTDADTLTFESPETGLSLSRDGQSRSFMPLHGLSLTWDRVVFDPDHYEVRLEGGGGAYTYIVPPSLRERLD